MAFTPMPRPSCARVDETHQRRIDAHDPRRAESLHDACDREHRQAVRQRAEQRGEGEEGKARQIDAPITRDLAE
jgi:hypothetical protein